EAASAYRRIENFVQRATERVGPGALGELPPAFVEAMDDDLNTSRAMAVIHDLVREANASLASGDESAVRVALAAVRGMLDVFGLDPLNPQWSDRGRGDDLTRMVDALVSLALEQ